MLNLPYQNKASLGLLLSYLFIVGLLVMAPIAAWGEAIPTGSDKPFAEHFLVLQISDDDPAKQAMVLSVASNLMEYYDPDMVDIEIVAFGPGIELLFADSDNAELVDSLAAQGVRFAGCMNTIETIIRKTGKKPELNENMIPVQAGVARILELTGEGYTLVRP